MLILESPFIICQFLSLIGEAWIEISYMPLRHLKPHNEEKN